MFQKQGGRRGSQASLRRTRDSALRAMYHIAHVPWLLSLHFPYAHGGGRGGGRSTKSMSPKELCIVDTEFGGV